MGLLRKVAIKTRGYKTLIKLNSYKTLIKLRGYKNGNEIKRL
jgi:hypothetical protein